MSFLSEYHIRIQGERKGPYTFQELKRLFDRNLIPPETLYWREDMEQWESVSELCGKPLKKRPRDFRRKQLIGGLAALAVLVLLFRLAPMVIDGWKETRQTMATPEAAYWIARGFVRDEVRKTQRSISFDAFSSTSVSMNDAHQAAVILPCTMFDAGGAGSQSTWHVSLSFDETKKQWLLRSAQKTPTHL